MTVDLQRTGWIDITKALAIILMVLGHTAIPLAISDFIFAFHMPVFFLITGFCTRWNSYSFRDFVLRRITTLIIPFIAYSIIVIIISYIIAHPLFSLVKGWQGYALWFVPVLFVSSIVAKLIKMIPHVYLRSMSIVLCFIIGYLLSHFAIRLPWTMSSVPYATFLILAGDLLKGRDRLIIDAKWYALVIEVIIVLFISRFWRLDMAWNKILPIIPLTISAFAGSAMLASFSVFVDKYLGRMSSLLQMIGKETFIILAFSQLVIIIINTYLSIGSLVKYSLLIVALSVAIIIKNKIKICSYQARL